MRPGCSCSNLLIRSRHLMYVALTSRRTVFGHGTLRLGCPVLKILMSSGSETICGGRLHSATHFAMCALFNVFRIEHLADNKYYLPKFCVRVCLMRVRDRPLSLAGKCCKYVASAAFTSSLALHSCIHRTLAKAPDGVVLEIRS